MLTPGSTIMARRIQLLARRITSPLLHVNSPRSFLGSRFSARAAGTRQLDSREQTNSSALLICPYQLSLTNNVALHGLFELCLGRLLQVRQHRVQRVELMEVAVTADWRAWASVASTLPVVHAFLGSHGQCLDVFLQPVTGRRQIIEHPMHPGHFRRSGIRGVGVV